MDPLGTVPNPAREPVDLSTAGRILHSASIDVDAFHSGSADRDQAGRDALARLDELLAELYRVRAIVVAELGVPVERPGHPAWCDPQECDVEGSAWGLHRSTWRDVETDTAVKWHLSLAESSSSGRVWVDILARYVNDWGPGWEPYQVELGAATATARLIGEGLVQLADLAEQPGGAA